MPLTTSSLLSVLTDIDSYLIDEFYKPKEKSNLKGSLLFKPNYFVDMKEDLFQIQVLVPGFTKESLKVEPNDDKITVSADVSNEEKRSFVRNFKLDFYAPSSRWDHSDIDAILESGVLTLKLYPREKKQNYTVSIR